MHSGCSMWKLNPRAKCSHTSIFLTCKYQILFSKSFVYATMVMSWGISSSRSIIKSSMFPLARPKHIEKSFFKKMLSVHSKINYLISAAWLQLILDYSDVALTGNVVCSQEFALMTFYISFFLSFSKSDIF